MATQPDQQPPSRREGRSPAYPFFSVGKALERADQLYRQETSHWAPLSSAVAAWGYSPKSSGGRQTLATMKYYGLIDVTGEADARRVRVSEIAKRILLDEREDQSEKRALIREVALSPSAHRAIYEEYKGGLPSDGTVLHFLMFGDKRYNKDAARDLLEEYKETASFIGLYEPQNAVDKSVREEHGEKAPPRVNKGDLIQATVKGQDLFPKGARVLGFSDDGAWVFTDQAKGGVKLEEITVLEAAQSPTTLEERPTIPASLLAAHEEDRTPAGTRKAVFPLKEGDVSLIYPEGLSEAGLKRLSAYFNIFLEQEIEDVKGS